MIQIETRTTVCATQHETLLSRRTPLNNVCRTSKIYVKTGANFSRDAKTGPDLCCRSMRKENSRTAHKIEDIQHFIKPNDKQENKHAYKIQAIGVKKE